MTPATTPRRNEANRAVVTPGTTQQSPTRQSPTIQFNNHFDILAEDNSASSQSDNSNQDFGRAAEVSTVNNEATDSDSGLERWSCHMQLKLWIRAVRCFRTFHGSNHSIIRPEDNGANAHQFFHQLLFWGGDHLRAYSNQKFRNNKPEKL